MLNHLIGQWLLKRRVVSNSGVSLARMDGIANFASLVERISRYHESGKLHLAGGCQLPVEFSRSYLYREEQGGLAVYFDEYPLRLFQTVPLMAVGDTLEGAANHHCAPDMYSSQYRFNLPYEFQSIHHVEGPRKNYSIITVYKR